MQHSLHTLKHSQAVHKKRLKRWGAHPFAIPLGLFVGLVLASGVAVLIASGGKPTATTANSVIVIVSHDQQRQTVPTNAPTVGKLLEKLNITLGNGDRVEPAPSTAILQDNFRVNVYRAVPVVVEDAGQQVRALSAATTPRSIAAQAGITVYPEDLVATGSTGNLLDGPGIAKPIYVQRSTPINLNLYGTQTPTRTQAKTVQQLLTEKKITLVDGATVTPAADTPLVGNMQVFILNKGVSIASKEEAVPMPIQNVDDKNLTLGSKAIRQKGSPGKQVVTYQITVDPATGKEVGRTVIQTVVVQNPVPQIVAIGKNVAVPRDKVELMRAVGIAESDYGYVDYIISHEAGWNGVTKYNYSGSGAYGICQALPGSKMASAGADWQTNPVTQLKWCDGYAKGRYGNWKAAYDFKIRTGWW
jgi:uncharacterized protein YabE (DUF348 family)